MARYRNDYEDDRDFRDRGDRFEGDRPPWSYNDTYLDTRRSFDNYRNRDTGRGRFGERAEYQGNEPRFTDYGERSYREEFRRPSYEGRDYESRPRYYDRTSRSRLRVRDIMTRELAVATRETPLRDVGAMMRDEDTGVIPVVDYTANGGNGTTGEQRRTTGQSYGYGKLVGLVTDRDMVIRAVAEGKDCSATRAEEVMSTDLYTARPHDRVVDVIRKMGDKQVRRIPIVNEGGRLLGMVSIGDVAVETEADRELAEALEDISKETSFWGKVFG